MTHLQALILGIIQGITEFFPISSSAHLRIAKKILAIPDGQHLLFFDLLCHGGTLVALILFLRQEIFQAFKDRQQLRLYFLALCPLVPAYFLLKPIRIFFSQPEYTGYFLIFTSLLLFATKYGKSFPTNKKWKNVLWIGCAQTMALIPGISRSGSTIATARFQGWNLMEAAKFSYLLAIPTILGGQFLETVKILKGVSEITNTIPIQTYAIGFFASMIVGLFSVKTVFWVYKKNLLSPFGWYCLIIGVLTLIFLHD